MSLVNVWITPTKAMVVVDTEGQAQAGGEYFEVSKMLTLPHANIVLAARGQNAFISVVFSLVHLGTGGTFDEIEASIETALAQATAYLKTMEERFFRSVYEQEIVLVGYSHCRRAMHCISYQSKDASGFEVHDVDEAYLSPWDGPAWGLPMPVTTAQHARIVSTEQVAMAKALDPSAPLGGRLLLAELTREDCRISTLDRITSRTRT